MDVLRKAVVLEPPKNILKLCYYTKKREPKTNQQPSPIRGPSCQRSRTLGFPAKVMAVMASPIPTCGKTKPETPM